MQDSGCPSSKSKKSYKKDSILFTFNEKWVKNMKKKSYLDCNIKTISPL